MKNFFLFFFNCSPMWFYRRCQFCILVSDFKNMYETLTCALNSNVPECLSLFFFFIYLFVYLFFCFWSMIYNSTNLEDWQKILKPINQPGLLVYLILPFFFFCIPFLSYPFPTQSIERCTFIVILSNDCLWSPKKVCRRVFDMVHRGQ